MKSIFSFLFKKKRIQSSVTLEVSTNGFYVIKVYGRYLIDTLTYNKEEADIFYNRTIELTKKENEIQRTVIKEFTFNINT